MSEKSQDPSKLWTPPVDPRFPQQNVTGWCFVMYRDYQRCHRLFKGKNADCIYLKDIYQSICPNAWIAKFDDQLKNGTFPAPLPCPKECPK